MFNNRYIFVIKEEMKVIVDFNQKNNCKFRVTECQVSAGWEVSYVRDPEEKSETVAVLSDEKREVIHLDDIGEAAKYIYELAGHSSFEIEVDAMLLDIGVYPKSACDHLKDMGNIE
jgi:hypothetical protein